MSRWILLSIVSFACVSCTMFGVAYDDPSLQGYHAEAEGNDGARFGIVESPELVLEAIAETLRERGRLEALWPASLRAEGTTAAARISAQVLPREDGGSRALIRARPLAGYTPRGDEALLVARSALAKLAAR